MQTFLFRMLNNDDTEWLHTQWETYGFQPPTNNQHFSLNKYRKIKKYASAGDRIDHYRRSFAAAASTKNHLTLCFIA